MKSTNHQNQENHPTYKYILQHFLDIYLNHRDVEGTLSLVTDDVYSIGTGVQEIAHNKEELRKLICLEVEQLPFPIIYSLDTYQEKEIAPGVFTCISNITTQIQLEGQPIIQYATRLTAGFRNVEGIYLAYQLHMSEPSNTQDAHEFFPVHYSTVESTQIDTAEQFELVDLMKRLLPGGAMGGYVEPGFPLYFINDELLQWLGYTYEEFIEENGRRTVNAMHPDDASMVETTVSDAFAIGNEYTVEYRMRKKDRTYIWVRDIGRKSITSEGRIAIISIIVDISGERQRQQSFENTIELMKKERRRTDRLTGLLNRASAEILIEQEIIRNHKGAFFLMDLDNFKLVNDTKGHPAGDKVLHDFAVRIQEIFPSTGILARFGGDEFVAFLPDYADTDQLKLLSEKVITCASGIIDDALLSDKLGVSIGIAIVPNDGVEFSELYLNADKSQYYAKRNGKGRYSFYGQDSMLPASVNTNPKIDTLVRMVQNVMIDNGAFDVEYEAFHKICQFIQRNTSRMEHGTQVMLFSLEGLPASGVSQEQNVLFEKAVRYSLRTGDLMMNFGVGQIAVLLVNCNVKDAGRVAGRITNFYKTLQVDKKTYITYEFRSIGGDKLSFMRSSCNAAVDTNVNSKEGEKMKEFPDKCEGGNDMAVQTFTLIITDMKYGEWQGCLVGEDNYEAEFRSVMELIKAISQKWSQ